MSFLKQRFPSEAMYHMTDNTHVSRMPGLILKCSTCVYLCLQRLINLSSQTWGTLSKAFLYL